MILVLPFLNSANRAQRGEHRKLRYSSKLPQESHVTRVKLADVADAVLHHGDTLDAHTEGKAADFFRIVGRLFFCSEGEDCGIDHAAAEEFNPAGVLALAAAFASAEDATDLHVCGGFGERKE